MAPRPALIPKSIASTHRGGARTLLGVTFDYRLVHYFTVDIADNPTTECVGAEARWSEGWTGYLMDDVVLPIDPMWCGELAVTHGWGVARDPLAPGEVFSTGGGGTAWNDAAIVDPAYLNPLTGTGTHMMMSLFTVSELEFVPFEGFPGEPGPEITFDPDSFDIALDSVYVDMTVTYHYTPEPTSLGLLGLAGGLCLIRRMRSR